jgi:hypothetical protein
VPPSPARPGAPVTPWPGAKSGAEFARAGERIAPRSGEFRGNRCEEWRGKLEVEDDSCALRRTRPRNPGLVCIVRRKGKAN